MLNIPNDVEEEEDMHEVENHGEVVEDEWQITDEEMAYALGKMKNGKAPGEDMIPAEILKNVGGEGSVWMKELMNKCWREERTPKEWNRSVICSIF